jgi:hypothetical protein
MPVGNLYSIVLDTLVGGFLPIYKGKATYNAEGTES